MNITGVKGLTPGTLAQPLPNVDRLSEGVGAIEDEEVRSENVE